LPPVRLLAVYSGYPTAPELVPDRFGTEQVIKVEVDNALLVANVRNFLPLITLLIDARFLLGTDNGKSKRFGKRNYC
jgi:hypothetical protein